MCWGHAAAGCILRLLLRCRVAVLRMGVGLHGRMLAAALTVVAYWQVAAKREVASLNRPYDWKTIGMTSYVAYLSRLCCSVCVMAIPAVTVDGWLPAKAACVRAEVNIMSD